MKLKLTLILLFSILVIPGWSASHKRQKQGSYGNDLIGKYEKNLDEMVENYAKIRLLIQKKESEIEKKRNINSSYSSSAKSVTGNTNSTKAKREAAAKKISNLKKQVSDEQSDIEKMLKKNAEMSILLQEELIVLGIGDNFNFPYFSDTLIKTYTARGIDCNFDKEDMQLTKAEDPAVTIRAAKFDVKTLRDSGIDLSAPNPVPDTYLQYRTFFRFYDLLSFYRTATGDFNRIKDPHAKAELSRRYKMMKPAAMALNRLLEKNAPLMAKKVNLTQMMNLIEKHFKTEAFRDLGVFDDLLNSKNMGFKKGSGDFDKFLSENAKKKSTTTLSANSSKKLDGSIRVVMKESFDILNRTAADLRKASTADDSKKRSSRKNKTADDKPELQPETLLFRNADAPVVLPKKEDAPAEPDQQMSEKEPVKEPQKKEKQPTQPEHEDQKKDEKKTVPAQIKDDTESPAVQQKEATTITEKSEWE